MMRSSLRHMSEDHEPELDKFKALARELECDDDEAGFDARLKKLANARQKPSDPPKRPRASHHRGS